MEKFFNLMYDFFAFALPGSCIIVSFFLIYIDNGFLYHSAIPIKLKESLPHFFIVLAITGYIVGYTITPIGRLVLRGYLNCKINTNNIEKKKQYTRLKNKLFSDSLSKIFIQLREKTRTSSQYIEFWDMHSKMSCNFSIATMLFFVIQPINYYNIYRSNMPYSDFDEFLISLFTNDLWLIISSIILILIIIGILENSVRYSIWWSNDIDAACSFRRSLFYRIFNK